MDFNDLKTRRILITVASVVVLLFGAYAMSTWGDGSRAELGDLDGAQGSDGVVDSGSSLDGENVTLATDADDAEDGSSGSGDGSGSDSDDADASAGNPGSDGDSGSDSGTDSDDTEEPVDPDATMSVLVLFWNDTDAVDPVGARIAIEDASWSPDTSGESDAGSLAGLPFGEEIVLTIYPDGTEGAKLTVPVTFTPDMLPDSEQDGIHVEVSDEKVRVIGNAVANFDVAFDRF